MEKDIINKLVLLIFEDNGNTQRREGKVIDISNKFIIISSKHREEMIPIRRIVRIQMKGGSN